MIPPVAVGQAGVFARVVTFGIPGSICSSCTAYWHAKTSSAAVFVLSDVCIAAIRAAFCVAIAA